MHVLAADHVQQALHAPGEGRVDPVIRIDLAADGQHRPEGALPALGHHDALDAGHQRRNSGHGSELEATRASGRLSLARPLQLVGDHGEGLALLLAARLIDPPRA